MGKSARKKPHLPKSNPKSEQDTTSDPPPIILSRDDEADDDLSLKIVQKAMLRACGNETTTNPSSSVAEVKKKRKKMKEKEKKIGVPVNVVEDVEAKEDDVAPVMLMQQMRQTRQRNLIISFCESFLGVRGILILRTTAGEIATIVVKAAIQLQTVRQQSTRSLVLFVGVWSIM